MRNSLFVIFEFLEKNPRQWYKALDISKETGLNNNTVRRAIVDLKGRGYLDRKRPTHGSNETFYTVKAGVKIQTRTNKIGKIVVLFADGGESIPSG